MEEVGGTLHGFSQRIRPGTCEVAGAGPEGGGDNAQSGRRSRRAEPPHKTRITRRGVRLALPVPKQVLRRVLGRRPGRSAPTDVEPRSWSRASVRSKASQTTSVVRVLVDVE